MEQFDPTLPEELYKLPEEQDNTREELKKLKQEITGSIDENLSDRTDSLRNNLNPYRTEYGAGIYKNPRW